MNLKIHSINPLSEPWLKLRGCELTSPEDAEYMLKFVRQNKNKLHNKPDEVYLLTCSHCQLVCGPTIKERKEAYKSVIEAGVIYDPDKVVKAPHLKKSSER